MVWWLWVLIGLGLLALEIVTPSGFYIFFFGVGALITGLLVEMELAGPPWMQGLLFSILSGVSVLLLRQRVSRTFSDFSSERDADPGSLIGEAAVLLGELRPGGVGHAELRGTSWTVRAKNSVLLPSGTHCIVEKVDGVTLWVRADEGDSTNA